MFKKVMRVFRRLAAMVQYEKAVEKAETALMMTGQRQYVVCGMDGEKRKLVIMDRRNFRMLRMKHYIRQGMDVKALKEKCVYCTGYANGSGVMTVASRRNGKKRALKWMSERK